MVDLLWEKSTTGWWLISQANRLPLWSGVWVTPGSANHKSIQRNGTDRHGTSVSLPSFLDHPAAPAGRGGVFGNAVLVDTCARCRPVARKRATCTRRPAGSGDKMWARRRVVLQAARHAAPLVGRRYPADSNLRWIWITTPQKAKSQWELLSPVW
jgi:hypothetical protein